MPVWESTGHLAAACQGVGLSPVLVSLGWVYFRDGKRFCLALAGSGVCATEV